MDARESNVRTWSMLCHLAALAGLIFPLGAVLGPLIIWLVKKNELPEIDSHGKASLNFQLTIFLAYIVLTIILFATLPFGFGFGVFWRSPFSFLFGWGFGVGMLMGLLSLAALVLAVIAGIKANNGESFKYPVSIPFVK